MHPDGVTQLAMCVQVGAYDSFSGSPGLERKSTEAGEQPAPQPRHSPAACQVGFPSQLSQSRALSSSISSAACSAPVGYVFEAETDSLVRMADRWRSLPHGWWGSDGAEVIVAEAADRLTNALVILEEMEGQVSGGQLLHWL